MGFAIEGWVELEPSLFRVEPGQPNDEGDIEGSPKVTFILGAQ